MPGLTLAPIGAGSLTLGRPPARENRRRWRGVPLMPAGRAAISCKADRLWRIRF